MPKGTRSLPPRLRLGVRASPPRNPLRGLAGVSVQNDYFARLARLFALAVALVRFLFPCVSLVRYVSLVRSVSVVSFRNFAENG